MTMPDDSPPASDSARRAADTSTRLDAHNARGEIADVFDRRSRARHGAVMPAGTLRSSAARRDRAQVLLDRGDSSRYDRRLSVIAVRCIMRRGRGRAAHASRYAVVLERSQPCDDALAEFLRSLLPHVVLPDAQLAILRTTASNSRAAERSARRVLRRDVALPPLPEQRKIAAILSAVDEVIEKTEAVIESLQTLKKAMMQELLTRGLPGRHTRFKQTEIGEIPEEWEAASVRRRRSTGHDVGMLSHGSPTSRARSQCRSRDRNVDDGLTIDLD